MFQDEQIVEVKKWLGKPHIYRNPYCFFVPCGDGLFTLKEMTSLNGGEGFFEEYIPVFLAGKNKGAKNLLILKLCAGIVSVVFWCPRIVSHK